MASAVLLKPAVALFKARNTPVWPVTVNALALLAGKSVLASSVVIAALVRAVALPLEDVMDVAGVGESMRSPLA